MIDTYHHKGLRKQLATTLQQKGINDNAVLAAIQTVPRHLFLDSAFEKWAYTDKAFPILKGQTISQPFTVAYQTSLLQIAKRDKVLEIGTGSGYQAAILGTMGARVYSLERHEQLYQRSTALLERLALGNIRTYFKDGYKGLPELAPFDKIIATAATSKIPESLTKQLAIGGIFVLPVEEGEHQYMYRITRKDKTHFKVEKLSPCRFVPFLDGLDST